MPLVRFRISNQKRVMVSMTFSSLFFSSSVLRKISSVISHMLFAKKFEEFTTRTTRIHPMTHLAQRENDLPSQQFLSFFFFKKNKIYRHCSTIKKPSVKIVRARLRYLKNLEWSLYFSLKASNICNTILMHCSSMSATQSTLVRMTFLLRCCGDCDMIFRCTIRI